MVNDLEDGDEKVKKEESEDGLVLLSSLFGQALVLLSEWKKCTNTEHLSINKRTNSFLKFVSSEFNALRKMAAPILRITIRTPTICRSLYS